MKEAGHAGEYDRMNDIGSDHNLRRVAVKQKQQHHDDAARTNRGHAYEEARRQSDRGHACEGFGGGQSIRNLFFDAALQQQQRRNQDKQDSDCGLYEVVHANAVQHSQMLQEAHAKDRSRHAAHRQRNYYLSPDCSFTQMNDTGGDLGKEVEQRVRTDSDNRRHPQSKNKYWQEQHAATQPGKANQRTHREADDDFKRDQFHRL